MKTNFYMTKEELVAMIEHSVHGPAARRVNVKQGCLDALKYGFPVVYVNPTDASFAKEVLGGKVHVGIPIGFPTGVFTTDSKIKEGLEAIDNGADDLDTVMNISRFLDGDENYVREEICRWNEALKSYRKDIVTKVIVECHYLTSDQIARASNIVADSGVDYVKTSSGCSAHPTFLLSHVHIMKKTVGDRIKIKVSGHLPLVEDAIACMQYGAVRIGTDQGTKYMENFDNNLWNEK
jgi:deoxyribose-phosphate aldolase